MPILNSLWGKFIFVIRTNSGPGSSIGIATDYGLDVSGIESRWERDFPPVQTGPGAQQASCITGTGSFLGVKYGGGVLLTTHPLLAPRSWKSRAIPLPTLWATTGPVTGTLYLFNKNQQNAHTTVFYPLSYGVPVRERYGSTLLPATREQQDQNCKQSH